MQQSLPLPAALPQPPVSGVDFDGSPMQQPTLSRLFDPTALLAKGHSPALNGFGQHSSPPLAGAMPGKSPSANAHPVPMLITQALSS